MSRTLVVIDMQYDFWAAREEGVIAGCQKQIRKAKRFGWPIVFVEYDGCCATLPELRELANDHPYTTYITKNDDDGSDEVLECLERFGWPNRTLRVCGVNAFCCVAETVNSLLWEDKKMQIELTTDAVGDEDYDLDWDDWLEVMMPNHNRVRLV